MPFFRKATTVQKGNEQVIYILRATNRRQRGLFVYLITLKAYRMCQSYHSMKCENILILKTDAEKKLKKKLGHNNSLSDNTGICLY